MKEYSKQTHGLYFVFCLSRHAFLKTIDTSVPQARDPYTAVGVEAGVKESTPRVAAHSVR